MNIINIILCRDVRADEGGQSLVSDVTSSKCEGEGPSLDAQYSWTWGGGAAYRAESSGGHSLGGPSDGEIYYHPLGRQRGAGREGGCSAGGPGEPEFWQPYTWGGDSESPPGERGGGGRERGGEREEEGERGGGEREEEVRERRRGERGGGREERRGERGGWERGGERER